MLEHPLAKGEVICSPSGLKYQLINSDDKPLLVLIHSYSHLASQGLDIQFIPPMISLRDCSWVTQEVKQKTLESWNK